ncbi:MAG: ABC transporter substrate-binding protein [Chloroflexota bacterium]
MIRNDNLTTIDVDTKVDDNPFISTVNQHNQRPIMNRIIYCLTTLLLLALLVACGPTEVTSPAADEPVAEATSVPEEATSDEVAVADERAAEEDASDEVAATEGECEEGFRLVEHTGGETCIPEDPQRIAVVGDRHIGEILIALGVEPVAVTTKEEYPEFVQEEFSDFNAVIDLANHIEPNLEVLAEVGPDLIIMHGDFYDTVSQIAPTVQIADPFVGVRQIIIDVGSIFGEDQTEALLALVDNAVETVTCAVENPDEITVSGTAPWQGQFEVVTTRPFLTHSFLLQEAGFTIPEDHAEISESRLVSLERLDVVDTDVLFVHRFYMEDEDPDATFESPLWQNLEVVQNGNVIEGDFRWWGVGGPLAAQRTADEIVAGLEEIGLATPCETN